MKNLLIQLLLLLMFSLFNMGISPTLLKGQTEIPGGIVKEKWTYSNSPYMVNGAITIPENRTLIIEPGVEVIFTKHEKFNIHGQLLAVGKKDSMITFTAHTYEIGWHGLRFQDIPSNNDSSKLVYCRIQYGLADGSEPGDKYGGGLAVSGYDKLLIAFCEITTNRTGGGQYSGGAGIFIHNCSPQITQNRITDNQTLDGHGGGIMIAENADPIITNNIIFNNTALGGGGISVWDQSKPVFINNTITQNRADHGGALDCVNSTPTFINTIMYANSADDVGDEVHLANDYTSNFLACDISGGLEAFAQFHQPGCPDYIGRYEYNIDANPMFLNAFGDFHLADSSACIATGIESIEVDGTFYRAPKTDFESQPRPRPNWFKPDIGAIEHDQGSRFWTSMEPIPANGGRSTGCELDGKIYVVGGSFFSSDSVSHLSVYDPKTNTWDTTIANLPVGLYGAASSAVNGKFYVIGGRSYPVVLNSVYEYDPATNIWTSKANMLTARTGLSTIVVDEKIYAMGGSNGSASVPSVEMYDPIMNTWTSKGNMLTGRFHFASEAVNGKIYVMGGRHSGSTLLSTVEEYDPQMDSWSEIGDMPQRRYYHGSGVINNQIYVFGGHNFGMENCPTWKSKLPAPTWSEIEADFPLLYMDEFVSAVAENAEDKECLYSIGGIIQGGPIPINAVLKYCPQSVLTANLEKEFAPVGLIQNYPNPFNTKMTIKYELKNTGKVCIKVFNLAGQEVATPFEGDQPKGEHEIEWNADGLPDGVYFYRMQTDGIIATGKCMLQKLKW